MFNKPSEQRSSIMRAVHSYNTAPELAVRRLLRIAGLTGYRIHRKDIPGKPDIAFIGRKKAIFVHGCFWHGHNCQRGSRIPKTNTDYWQNKINRNRQRDSEHQDQLAKLGWSVMIIWECEISNPDSLRNNLLEFLR
jgi:DNA mismatch endonuclease, patch repair protein